MPPRALRFSPRLDRRSRINLDELSSEMREGDAFAAIENRACGALS